VSALALPASHVRPLDIAVLVIAAAAVYVLVVLARPTRR